MQSESASRVGSTTDVSGNSSSYPSKAPRPWQQVNKDVSSRMLAATSDSPPMIPKRLVSLLCNCYVFLITILLLLSFCCFLCFVHANMPNPHYYVGRSYVLFNGYYKMYYLRICSYMFDHNIYHVRTY